MNTQKLKNPRTITVVVEGDEYEKFLDGLPRKKGFSETVREWIKSANDETIKEKNLNAPNYGAIKTQESNISIESDDKNLSLDLFTINRRDIPEIIQEIDGKGLLGKLMGDARLVLSCSKRQIENL